MTAIRNLTRLQELDDVEVGPPLNGELPIWNQAAGKFVYGSVGLDKLAPNTAPATIAPRWQSGRYYFTPNYSVTTSVTQGNNTLRMIPFVVPNNVTIIRIGAEITLAGDGTSVLRLGIYADDGTGRPGALVIDAGTIPGNVVAVQEIVVNQALSAGLYWTAAVIQGVVTTQPTVRVVSNSGIAPQIDVLSAIPAAGVSIVGFSQNAVVAAGLPANVGTVSTAGTSARMFVKVQ